MSTLAEMYVQGESADLRSVRKATKLAESLCGHAFSYGTISTLVATLDDDLQAFATLALDDTRFPYLILDARYEKVREQGANPSGADRDRTRQKRAKTRPEFTGGGMIDTHGRLALTHLQVGQRNHPKRNLQKTIDIT